MKEKMDKNSIDALIGYRCQRSDEAIQEAELLCQEGFYNAAVNRLYYACYYVISALFLKDDIQAHTHSGMKTLFGMHYVKTKRFLLIRHPSIILFLKKGTVVITMILFISIMK